MPVFAKLLNPGLPVIDNTGLDGQFDLHLEWTQEPAVTETANSGTASDPPGTSLIAALNEQLGLRLRRGRGSRDFLVVQHLERPTEN